MSRLLLVVALAAAQPGAQQSAVAAAQMARGLVFVDRDRDGARDPGEPGLPGVRISNGREIVYTAADGSYAIGVDDDDIVFVVKPRGFMVAMDENRVPRGYHVHKPQGSPDAGYRYRGVAPTGPLPASIDFPLTPNVEPERFDMLAFGDPQPRDLKEVDWIGHDVLDGLDVRGAGFALALGDIAFDDLDTLEPLNATLGRLGVPMWYVHGNHDMNYEASHDDLADETWERVYGPANYSFDWGPVHYVVLDDVLWHPAGSGADGRQQRGHYTGEFDADALTFLRADLAEVPAEQFVVVAFHIHLDSVANRREFLGILNGRPHTLSLSAHTHVQRIVLFGADDGWAGPEPHVHVNHGTLCGSWFRGQPDLRGIPHATMADGTPNGWGVFRFAPDGWSHRYHGAGMPADEQMRVTAPAAVEVGATAGAEVVVNVFAGSERSVTELRVGGRGPWLALRREERTDPAYQATFDAEAALLEMMPEPTDDETVPGARRRPQKRLPWLTLPRPSPCTHLWVGTLPADLPVGTHRIEVRTTDMFGQVFRAERTLRVTPPATEAPAPRGR
ncbi:MAG: calcineurin-like phosphoesterase C-terminal domain-containing protein [Planctomycetes bacterium]|nr:calcineurin-like phosphoesterase C-terminal domain-containing protein [Planctomycetota bacterium]